MATQSSSAITSRFARLRPHLAFCSILLGIVLGSWSERFSTGHVPTEAIEIEVADDHHSDMVTGILEPTGAVWYAGSYELPSCLVTGDASFTGPAIYGRVCCQAKRSRAPPS